MGKPVPELNFLYVYNLIFKNVVDIVHDVAQHIIGCVSMCKIRFVKKRGAS